MSHFKLEFKPKEDKFDKTTIITCSLGQTHTAESHNFKKMVVPLFSQRTRTFPKSLH